MADITTDYRPYRALQEALLADAFKTLAREPLIVQRRSDKRKRLRIADTQSFRLAARWLTSERDDNPLDCVSICHLFGIDVRTCHKAVRRIQDYRKRLATTIRQDPAERAKIRWRKTDGRYWTHRVKPPWLRRLYRAQETT